MTVCEIEAPIKTGAQWVKNNDKVMLVINYEGTSSDEEMVKIIKEAQQMIIEYGNEYVQLTNMKNAFATSEFMKEAKKIAKETPKLATKRAIVGIDSPARVILLKAYNFLLGTNGMKPFNTVEEAQDWLFN